MMAGSFFETDERAVCGFAAVLGAFGKSPSLATFITFAF